MIGKIYSSRGGSSSGNFTEMVDIFGMPAAEQNILTMPGEITPNLYAADNTTDPNLPSLESYDGLSGNFELGDNLDWVCHLRLERALVPSQSLPT
jgi:hypothetical protein